MDGMNNNGAINPSISERKTQTFNLIIGIATLLIALLGATFAYFTATARSAEGEVTVKSAMVSIKFDHGTAIKASNLIPSTEAIALSKYKKSQTPFVPTVDETYISDFDEFLESEDPVTDLPKYMDRRCVDANGREVCYVFWFSVTSDGDTEDKTDILSYIKISTNEFDNLSYLVYDVTYQRDADNNVVNDKYGHGVVNEYKVASTQDPSNPPPFAKFGKLVNTPKEGNDNELGDTIYPIACLFGETDDASTKEVDDTSRCLPYQLDNGVEKNFQIVIWLNETDQDQPEQGKVFNGTVAVEVMGNAENGGHITGQ